jgi:ubiquinone/menaquinone biosynthesis C-methylase UbiE
MRDVVAETRATYDQIARTYAEVNCGPLSGTLLALARELARSVGEGAHIIDVGCGPGRDVAWFETQNIRVTAIDLSRGMVEHATSVAEGPVLRMDMRQLAFCDGCFDGAWCAASLLHLPKRTAPAALREISRVIRPGGSLMLTVKGGDGEGWAGGYVAGATRFFSYYRPAEMAGMLVRAGFGVSDSGLWRSRRRREEWLSFHCSARE